MPTPSPEETSDSGTLLGVFENVPERNLGESAGLMVSEQVGVCPAQPGKAGQSTAAHQGNLPGVSTGLGDSMLRAGDASSSRDDIRWKTGKWLQPVSHQV